MAAGRVVIVSAVLVAVLFLYHIAWAPPRRDDTSFRAGYTAASNGPVVRAAMTRPGMTTSAFCAAILDDALLTGASTTIVASDFLAGCRRAVVDAME